MMSPRFLLAIALLGMLAACETAVLSPFETVPPPLSRAERNEAGDKPPTRVAICYNMFTTSAATVLALAKESCDPETAPKPLTHDVTFDNCPILQPSRATFVCNKP